MKEWRSEQMNERKITLRLISAAHAKGTTLDLKDIKNVQVLQCGFTCFAKKCPLTPLDWNTCSCFSVLQRMLLRSIISENFKACQKHSPFGVCSSLKMYLYFPNGQEEALTGIEVMLMQCGASFQCNSVYSTKIQPVLNTINLLWAWFYITFNFP